MTGWYDDDKADFNWGNLVAQTGLNYKFKPEMSAEFTAAYRCVTFALRSMNA